MWLLENNQLQDVNVKPIVDYFPISPHHRMFYSFLVVTQVFDGRCIIALCPCDKNIHVVADVCLCSD